MEYWLHKADHQPNHEISFEKQTRHQTDDIHPESDSSDSQEIPYHIFLPKFKGFFKPVKSIYEKAIKAGGK